MQREWSRSQSSVMTYWSFISLMEEYCKRNGNQPQEKIAGRMNAAENGESVIKTRAQTLIKSALQHSPGSLSAANAERIFEDSQAHMQTAQRIAPGDAVRSVATQRYNKRYNALVERYDKLKAEYDEVSTLISDNDARNEQMGRFITVLKEQDGVLTEFDEGLWGSLVEKLVVKSKTDVTMVFKDGTEIKAE